jgi:hypothetical protein
MLTHREYKQLEVAIHGTRKYDDGSYILSPKSVIDLLKTCKEEEDEQSSNDICPRGDDRGSEGEQG